MRSTEQLRTSGSDGEAQRGLAPEEKENSMAAEDPAAEVTVGAGAAVTEEATSRPGRSAPMEARERRGDAESGVSAAQAVRGAASGQGVDIGE